VTILFLNPTGRIGGAESVLLEMLGGLAEAHPSWRLVLIVASEGPLVARARALGACCRSRQRSPVSANGASAGTGGPAS
jgi:hypothetical protein